MTDALQNALDLANPIGRIVDYAGSAAPSGWLLCFGQAVSRSTYSDLFDVISTTYGSGDGSTTFNVPDIRGRVVAGQDDMGGTSANRLTDQSGGLNGDTLGATGGAETHTLTEAQLPSHTHSFSATTSSDGAHTHGPGVGETFVTAQTNETGSNMHITGTSDNLNVNTPTTTSSNGAHTHTVSGTSGSTGSGTAHNNVQPTIVLNKIIFAGV